MKNIIVELRMYLAELLLGLVFTICTSKHSSGVLLKRKIAEYFDEILFVN